ncbi:MAG: DUF5615 family PIN-like protein [Sedimentisphaerales bacterium]|jgi:predicted nuclease of predicted toxin-antitoxin system
MKSKIDENMPTEIAELLQNAGHDSVTVPAQNLVGASDATLAVICRKENRILVTLGTDFADIRTYPPDKFPGIMVMRLNRQDRGHVLEVFSHVISLLRKEPTDGRLWIVEEDKVRIRS